MTYTAAEYDDGPIAFRYPRGNGTGVPLPDKPEKLEIGKGRVVRAGKTVAIFSLGTRLAEVLRAEKLILMTNTPGVLDKNGKLLTGLTPSRIDELVADGTLSGGMLPKIASALEAARNGVRAVHIIDGRVEHALLVEILTDHGVGTMIRAE